MADKGFIGIVDYDMGNLMSVSRAFETLGYRVKISESAKELEDARGIVLPGVGAFKDCMNNLVTRDLTGFLKEWILGGRPFLGICLGLQLLFSKSYEFGAHEGLSLIKGRVVRFDEKGLVGNEGEGEAGRRLKIPHMGWNSVTTPDGSRFFDGISQGSYFYFVHSYYVVPEENVSACITRYGLDFVSGVERENMVAVQFHPEKSQKVGLRFLDNFGKYALESSWQEE